MGPLAVVLIGLTSIAGLYLFVPATLLIDGLAPVSRAWAWTAAMILVPGLTLALVRAEMWLLAKLA